MMGEDLEQPHLRITAGYTMAGNTSDPHPSQPQFVLCVLRHYLKEFPKGAN